MAKADSSGLTLQQRIFIDEYMQNRKGTESAITAGYAKISAHVTATRLLSNDKIKNEIARRERRLQEKSDITVERILQEEKRLGYANAAEATKLDGTPIPPRELPEDLQRALSGYDVIERVDGQVITRTFKYRFWDKGKSIERMSRHLGLYNDRLQISFDEGVQVILDCLPGEIREQVIAKVALMHSGKGK